MSESATLRIPVGVVVERYRACSPWLDAVYRPVSVLSGVPATAPWTTIDSNARVTTLYAGEAVVELFRTETALYQQNLASGTPSLWVVLRPVATEIPYALLLVTADPSEGEALSGAGNDLVEAVPMPAAMIETIAGFVARHPPSGSFFKRQRDRSAPSDREPGTASFRGRGSRS
jgi:Protein of unknown function (DUF3305)